MVKKKRRMVLLGAAAFILGSIALLAFEDAVYRPLVGFLTQAFSVESWQAYVILLIASVFLLAAVLKKNLPS